MTAMSPGDEIVAIVDRNNEVIGSTTRREMRAGRLTHRSTYILVFNSRGELWVQKRTMTKDVFPGYWDVAAGGVVLAGESYEEGARRELGEELGVVDAPLRGELELYYEDERTKVWGRVFTCVQDGPFRLQEEEIVSAELMSIDAVLERSKLEPFTPDGLYVLRRYQLLAVSH